MPASIAVARGDCTTIKTSSPKRTRRVSLAWRTQGPISRRPPRALVGASPANAQPVRRWSHSGAPGWKEPPRRFVSGGGLQDVTDAAHGVDHRSTPSVDLLAQYEM